MDIYGIEPVVSSRWTEPSESLHSLRPPSEQPHVERHTNNYSSPENVNVRWQGGPIILKIDSGLRSSELTAIGPHEQSLFATLWNGGPKIKVINRSQCYVGFRASEKSSVASAYNNNSLRIGYCLKLRKFGCIYFPIKLELIEKLWLHNIMIALSSQ